MWTERSSGRSGYGKIMERLSMDIPFVTDIALQAKDPSRIAAFFASAGVETTKQHADMEKVFMEHCRRHLKLQQQKPSVAKKVERWCKKCCPRQEKEL